MSTSIDSLILTPTEKAQIEAAIAHAAAPPMSDDERAAAIRRAVDREISAAQAAADAQVLGKHRAEQAERQREAQMATEYAARNAEATRLEPIARQVEDGLARIHAHRHTVERRLMDHPQGLRGMQAYGAISQRCNGDLYTAETAVRAYRAGNMYADRVDQLRAVAYHVNVVAAWLGYWEKLAFLHADEFAAFRDASVRLISGYHVAPGQEWQFIAITPALHLGTLPGVAA
jgi:hypothetical protein